MLSRMTKFTGEGATPWRVWLSRFEIQAADIEEEERVKILLMLLDGKALDVCVRLPEKARACWTEVTSALTKRFSPVTNKVEAYALLQRARLLPGETIEEFADRVESLVDIVHPAAKAALDTVGKNQFICGLGDESLQCRLLEDDKAKFKDVVSKAAAMSRSRVIAAKLNNDPGLASLGTSSCDQKLMGAAATDSQAGLSKLADEMGELRAQLAAVREEASSRGKAVAGPRCFSCQELGHISRNCPKKSDGPRNARCYLCDQIGHFKRACPQGTRNGPVRAQNAYHLGGAHGNPTWSAVPPERCGFCGLVGHSMMRCAEWGQMWKTMTADAPGSGLNPQAAEFRSPPAEN